MTVLIGHSSSIYIKKVENNMFDHQGESLWLKMNYLIPPKKCNRVWGD